MMFPSWYELLHFRVKDTEHFFAIFENDNQVYFRNCEVSLRNVHACCARAVKM